MKFMIVLLALVAMVVSQGVNVVDNSRGVDVVEKQYGDNPFPNNPDDFVIDQGFYMPGVSDNNKPADNKPPGTNNNADYYPKYHDPALRGGK